MSSVQMMRNMLEIPMGRCVLTPKQREVLWLLLEGHEISEIARQLVVAQSTVKKHAAGIYEKLEIENRGQLAKWVIEETEKTLRAPLLISKEELFRFQ